MGGTDTDTNVSVATQGRVWHDGTTHVYEILHKCANLIKFKREINIKSFASTYISTRSHIIQYL